MDNSLVKELWTRSGIEQHDIEQHDKIQGYLADVELIGRIALESLYVGHELRIGNDHKGQEWGLGDNAATLPGSPP
ncbi:hypothetical protein ACKVWC_010499 [Pyricularia oryzae]